MERRRRKKLIELDCSYYLCLGWPSRGSRCCWDDLEKRFHKYFFTGIHEMRLADLIMIQQRNDQSVPEYIQRFRDIMRTQCFSLNLMMASLLSWRFKEFYLYSKKKNILPKSLNVLGR